MELSNINAAYSKCKSLYDVFPSEEDFEDLALEAGQRIGNKHTRLYRYVGDVKNRALELPCNATGEIESVHIPVPDAQTSSNKEHIRGHNSIGTESYIDFGKGLEDPYGTRGKLIKYDEGNNKLYFSHDYPKVMVVYHGIFVDDESGLPLVNDKELSAIATYIAYVTYYKEGLRKRDPNLMKMSLNIKEDGLRLCNAARIPEHLSQNDMNSILDVKTRWDRKQYGKSLKPML